MLTLVFHLSGDNMETNKAKVAFELFKTSEREKWETQARQKTEAERLLGTLREINIDNN